MAIRTRTQFSLSSRRGVTLLVGVFLVIISAIVVLGSMGREVLTSLRAYVGGEGLWSKGEKDAAFALSRYIASGDEAYFREFQSRLAVPLGDRLAREALDRPEPDFARAREGFLKGRNNEADVDGMSRLFVRYRRFRHMARAIDIWERGDRLIARLQKLGEDAHGRISAGTLPGDERARVLRELEVVNTEVTELEDAFSATLGEAARWSRDVIQKAILGMTVVLVGLAVLAAMRIGTTLDLQEDALRASALHDPLTGLPNRALFFDRIGTAIRQAQRQGQTLTVMFLDLDGFKEINDGYGHVVGDEVLVSVAGRLRSCLRRGDTVARVGGDEFLFLLLGATREGDVAALAGKVLGVVSEPILIGGRTFKLSASMGLGTYPRDGADAETLVASVDAAMYQAKGGGGNSYRFVAPGPGAPGAPPGS